MAIGAETLPVAFNPCFVLPSDTGRGSRQASFESRTKRGFGRVADGGGDAREIVVASFHGIPGNRHAPADQIFHWRQSASAGALHRGCAAGRTRLAEGLWPDGGRLHRLSDP